MTKEQFDKKYVGKDVYVKCTNKGTLEHFFTLAHDFGYRWRNGKSYLQTLFDFSNCERIVFNIQEGVWDFYEVMGGYGYNSVLFDEDVSLYE